MSTFDVQVACTPSPETLVQSRSFPAWSGESKLTLSSPTLSSCSGSGSDSSGTESSLPSYSVHRPHSLTFTFPLPPPAGTEIDAKIHAGTDTKSQYATEVDIQPLHTHKERNPGKHDPPAYIQGHEPAADANETHNILRLKQSLSLLQLPRETLHQFEQHDTEPSRNSKGEDGAEPQTSARPPRLELAFDSGDDAPLNFDGHDLDRLATLLRGLPTQVDTPGRSDTLDSLKAEEHSRTAGTTASQSPILSGLLSGTPSETVWEVDIALQPNQGRYEGEVMDASKSGDTAILRLELSPVEVAQLFSITMQSPSPFVPFGSNDNSGRFAAVDMYKGIDIAAQTPGAGPIQDRSTDISGHVSTNNALEHSEKLTSKEAAAMFLSPVLSTPDLDMMATPAMMDAWPTPVMGPQSTNFDSIARLLETAKPIGVTISAPSLGRTKSEKGVVHSDKDLMDSPQAESGSSPPGLSTPTPSVLNRPRAKARRDATTFFGTTRRDMERKLTSERLTSRSSTMAGSPMPTSKSMGALALPSHLSDGSDRPHIPNRKSSQGCIVASPASMDTVPARIPSPEVEVKVPTVSAASPDSCAYDITEDVHVHNHDSSPAAYWNETRQILDPDQGKLSSAPALLDELRRQHALEMGSEQLQAQTFQHFIPTMPPPTPATLQKVRTPKAIKTPPSSTTSVPRATRSGFGGQIFKAFRRSPRSPVTSIIRCPDPPQNIRPILVKPTHSAVGAIPMSASASKMSVKTALSTSASTPRTAVTILQPPNNSGSTTFANVSRAPAPATAPVVLKGQALHEVKQACQQKAALIRAAAMVAAAEEQRAAASAAYRAAEAALLASRRQSAAAVSLAGQQQSSGGSGGGGGAGDRPHSFHGQVAQILFAETPERQYNVPSIRTVKTPPSTAMGAGAAERGRPVDPHQAANASNTVLLSL
ncbi:hypothetical protein A4X13_0g1408 [Tilletia indica]|uniref:Uncharacterized protein n=1 Tax=Tilletia indica TaxID=43049 RepID=A0A177TPU4_9BASI|nr:hypothetical protein A4X13_0g1408 [Tilletia indica]